MSASDDETDWEREAGVPKAGEHFPGSELRQLHVPGSSLPPGSRHPAHAPASHPMGGVALAARVTPAASENFRRLQGDLDRFCWGGLLWGPWWAIYHRVWIGALGFIPPLGLGVCLWLFVKGRRLAWENGDYRSLARFQRAQRWWAVSGLLVPLSLVPVAYVAGGPIATAARAYVSERLEGEAKLSLEALSSGLIRCADAAGGQLPATSGWVPADLSLIAGKSHESPAAEWQKYAAFDCASFAPDRPLHYQYRWIAEKNRRIGKATARADHDGDGQVDEQISIAVSCTSRGCFAASPVAEPVENAPRSPDDAKASATASP